MVDTNNNSNDEQNSSANGTVDNSSSSSSSNQMKPTITLSFAPSSSSPNPPSTTNTSSTDGQAIGWFYKLRKDGGVIDRIIMFMFLIQMIAVVIWIILTIFVGLTTSPSDNLIIKEKPSPLSIVKPTLRFISTFLSYFGIKMNHMIGDEL